MMVVAGIVEGDDGLLLVKNRRRQGTHDWTTPGGVLDATDASLVEALTREVEEETGLRVEAWEGPLYEVEAHHEGWGWTMRAVVFRATGYTGEVRIDDPDGIVVDVAFVAADACAERLAGCHLWVGEPLAAWLAERWGPDAPRVFAYTLSGADLGTIEAVRRP
jgi:ADP-ribose pyrophosphatase YjhB (NUDIX family)